MEPGGEFGFQILSNYKFPSLENMKVKESLTKWSMIDGFKLQAFSFDKTFKKYSERDFLVDFLGCQNVVSSLLRAAPGCGFSPIGVPADLIKFSEVKCSLTTLEIFDKLKKNGKIIRENGCIVKCMPQYIRAGRDDDAGGGFEIEIADNLRKIILSDGEESEDFDEINDGILTERDKKEFLFLLFTHCVIGGSLCQYEDNIEPYMVTTKLLYKDLIAVAVASTGNEVASSGTRGNGAGDAADYDKLKVISHVYKIHYASNEQGSTSDKKNFLFNRNYMNNFMYVIVNPLKQVCFTLYHHV